MFILHGILRKLSVRFSGYFVLLIGACYGYMRFSTENETYILPIFLSLMGSYFFLQYLNGERIQKLVLSAIFFSAAALFHQIHILWFSGFFMALFQISGTKKYRDVSIFLGTGSLVVILVYVVYYSSLPFTARNGIVEFVLKDVYAGRVHTGISFNNVLLTPISFVRTFIQVHGYMIKMFGLYPILVLLPLCLSIILWVCVKAIFKFSTYTKHGNRIISRAILYSFALHFLFAFYSVGNAEFMVMLPLLAILWLCLNFNLPTKPFLYIGLMLLIWNVVFGLMPNYHYDLDGNSKLSSLVIRDLNKPWLLSEPQKIENIIFYQTGEEHIFLREEQFRQAIQKPKDLDFYTDLIKYQKPLSRHNFLRDPSELEKEFDNFTLSQCDTIYFFGGRKIVGHFSGYLPKQ